MCGRFIIEQNAFEFFNNADYDIKYGDIFPTDGVPAITYKNSEEVIDIFKWGFPSLTNTSHVINARAETIDTKPSFRTLLPYKRCLIPASGFYEWKRVDRKKQQYKIHIADNKSFYMAGLYDTFADKFGKPYYGFVIITTESSGKMTGIHSRMPAILTPPEAFYWLDPEITPTAAKNLLKPFNGSIAIEAI